MATLDLLGIPLAPTSAMTAIAPLTAPGTTPEATAAILAVIQELNAAADLRSGLARVAEHLRDCIDYDTLGILLLDDLGRELRFEFTVGIAPEVAEHWRFGLGQGIVGTVARERRPLRVGEVGHDPRYIRASDGVVSELAVPLLVRERAIGVLDICSARPHFFTEEHERLLGFLAGFLAGAIENARLYRNLREQAQTLSVLHEIGRQLSSILDRNQLLEKVAEHLERLIDYDLFSVMLWNEERRLLEPWTGYLRGGIAFTGVTCQNLGEGLCGAAAALRQPLRVPNVHLDPRYHCCKSGIEVNAEMIVPLVLEDRLLGILDFESSRYDAFSARHEQLVSTLASSLAIALENALLYERLRQDEMRVHEDLAMARELQAQLLPKVSPWVAGLQVGFAYEPARHLGGDFYDFLSYGEGRLAVAVGDVAGKSTPAALYGSFAVGMLREYATRGVYGPSQVLADMNFRLKELSIERRFLAMVFAVYDAAARTLTLASSGLPQPFHRTLDSNGDREVREIPVHGVPLGLLSDRGYEERVLHLQPGDLVVFCSDGVEESRDPEGEELGSRRIREILLRLADDATPTEIAQALLQASHRFTRGTEAEDDRTIVVLRVAD
jgi:sigma-B regulation protein RsbU (phosphoserine phosphatase)